MGKDWKRVKLAIPSHPKPLWWGKIGKIVKQVKLVILSHSVLLQWENIGTVAKWAKLAVSSHSAPLQWEKIGKVPTFLFLVGGEKFQLFHFWRRGHVHSLVILGRSD